MLNHGRRLDDIDKRIEELLIVTTEQGRQINERGRQMDNAVLIAKTISWSLAFLATLATIYGVFKPDASPLPTPTISQIK